MGLGGRGGYVQVITPNMDKVLWAASVAMCLVKDMADTKRGLVVVSRSTGERDDDGETMLAGNHVAEWPDFISALKTQWTAGTPSPGKRIMGFFPPELRESVLKTDPGKVDDTVKSMLMMELNNLIANRDDLYDETSFKGCALGWVEDLLVRKWGLKTISDADREELNRRLLELAFPRHIFASPKTNRPPIRKALQPDFGGGASDGHIYLLTRPRREE